MEKTVKNQNVVKATNAVKTINTEVKKIVAEVAPSQISDKLDFNESVNKVVATAQNVNNQIVEAASEVVANVKEVGNDIKDVATKTINDVAEKVDFSNSVEKVKVTAKNVNNQIKETATEVVAEVVAEAKVKSQEIKNVTTKLAKEAIENLNVSDRVKSVRKAVANTNAYALETSEELISTLEANGTKWQNVTEKAIKTGLKLAERQQNIVFSTLEAVKTQVGGTATRFRKLFSNN